MYTVTFYSYKGGVGRTSALMNVAMRLCSLGKRVCLLDFDLEAPGLDSYQSTHRDGKHQGLVEYIDHFVSTGSVPKLNSYSFQVALPDETGALFLMPAGRKDSAYQAALGRLDWKLLYKQKNGYLLVETLKQSISKELNVDYLLVDSRTGLTDVSGICTLQLPDLVVLLFNLNNQNINGTAQVYRSITQNRINRYIQTLLVASPIPDIPESLEIRSSRFDHARKAIGSPAQLIIPHDPYLSFAETIVDDQQSRSLSKSYRELTEKLIELNDRDVITLLSTAAKWREAGDLQLASLKYKEIVEAYPFDGNAWFEYGKFLRIYQDFNGAREAFEKSLSVSRASGAVRDRYLAELALTELHLGNREAAVARYNELARSVTDIRVLTSISQMFAERGEPMLALEVLTKGVAEQEPSNLWSRAQALTAAGRFLEAYHVYLELLSKLPPNYKLYFNAGYTAWMAKIPTYERLLEKAVSLFEKSGNMAKGREGANAFSAIAFAYERLGKREKAIYSLRHSLEIAKSLKGVEIFLFPDFEYVSVERFTNEVQRQISVLTGD